MPNFLYDNVALNGAKVNLNSLPGGADPNKYADAGLDWNPTIAAINDLRGGILSNMFLGIDTQASAPAVPVGGVNFFLWADSSGDLYWRKHGTGDQKLNAQAAAAVTSITAGIGLNGGTITTTGTIDLANTAVTPGSYTNANITIDSTGRIIAAANGSPGTVFPFAATVGSWDMGVLTNPGTNARFLQYTPNDASTTTWVQGVNSEANSPGPRRNQTMTMGWNLDVGGGRVASGALNGAIGLSFEQYYETVGSNKVMEQHHIYVSPADVQTRYISFMGNLESPYNTSLYIYSSGITLGYGVNASDPGSIFINQSETKVTVTSGYPRLSAEQTGQTIGIYNGDVGNADRGHLIVASDGIIEANSIYTIRIAHLGVPMVEVDASVTLTTHDLTSGRYQIADSTQPHIFYAPVGAFKFAISTTQVFAYSVPIIDWRDGGGESVSVVGLMTQNNAAAANGAQQYSPSLFLRGMGWKSDGGGSSQANGWAVQAQPVQGTAASSVDLVFSDSINEGAPVERLRLRHDAVNSITNIVSSGSTYYKNASAYFGFSGTGASVYATSNIILQAAASVTATTDTAYAGSPVFQIGITDLTWTGAAVLMAVDNGLDQLFQLRANADMYFYNVGTTDTGGIRYDGTHLQASHDAGATWSAVATLGFAQTYTAAQNVASVALTDGANIATDAALSNVFTVTLGGNRTLDNPTNLVNGGTYVWLITQDGTGSRTLSYGSDFKWPSGAAPTLSTAAGSVDMISAVCHGGVLRAVAALDIR